MAMACISATDLTVTFEPAPPVFQALDVHLAAMPVALIGPNGAGKTLLAECLAGLRTPQQGIVQQRVPVRFLSQRAAENPGAENVATFLGVAAPLAALDRLMAGTGRVDDLATLDEQWGLRQELEALLAQFQLAPDILTSPLRTLSGGQRTRLHLLKLSRQADTFLILDEPTNHLDQSGREWLMRWIHQRTGGALVITHDRALLDSFSQLLELRHGALQWHGQGFAAYEQARLGLLEKAQHDKTHARQALRKERHQQQLERERHEQRAARGRAKARKGDMPKVLQDARKDRSEATGGRIAYKHQAALDAQQQRVQIAESVLGRNDALGFRLTEPAPISGAVLTLRDVRLPWIRNMPPLNEHIQNGERWRLHGANGSGKSTLLAAICGGIDPLSGKIDRRGSVRRLDQHLSILNPDDSALDNFQSLNPGWLETAYRDRLALLRIKGEQALRPIGQLSGGEKLKVALACCLMGPETAQLLLLDEPDNHLDLESQALLADVLRQYQGSLMVVTHSEPFAEALLLERRLFMPTPSPL
ncbi:ATP-binding cassette domain-containing protein [Isoalcanivorax indicus]|uniref:ATP-binding cassette domain-containing protein n=1 Tax=Isoalcanivorax indicus TaxID=2202653 RepID=UPI000DB96FAC|nr:ATP-binding cassette domain-containing protein [Isoalcanivorax indicus]